MFMRPRPYLYLSSQAPVSPVLCVSLCPLQFWFASLLEPSGVFSAFILHFLGIYPGLNCTTRGQGQRVFPRRQGKRELYQRPEENGSCRHTVFNLQVRLFGLPSSQTPRPRPALSVPFGVSFSRPSPCSSHRRWQALKNPQVAHQNAAALLARAYLMSMSASPSLALRLSPRAGFLSFP